jgi:phosphate transport system permease protein
VTMTATDASPIFHAAPGGRRSDAVAAWAVRLALVVVVATLASILALIVRESLPVLADPSRLLTFLGGEPWSPLASPPRLGIGHAMVSTLMVTGLSLFLAMPAGVAIGLFLSEVAPSWMRGLLRPCLELLAGVPSVVYGFIGYVTLTTWFERWGGMATGESLLVASLVLSIMVLPFIASMSAEAFAAVPPTLRDSALSMGITRWHLVRRVLIPTALPGLFAGVALGIARALGETLAVLMLAGNSTAMPHSFLDRGQPLTALIATELPEAGVGTAKYHALYAAGLTLMAITLAINLLVWFLKGWMIRRAA